MNRKYYRKIAKKHGISVTELKRDMQSAIGTAYTDPDRNLINIKAQNSIPHKGAIPTPDELIGYATFKIKNQESTEKCNDE